MPNAISFLWNATRGSRLRPWRSEYIKWRVETYSGMKAETMTGWDVVRFTWKEKWTLLRFLRWTGKLETRSGR
jgi:hypothetical protein